MKTFSALVLSFSCLGFAHASSSDTEISSDIAHFFDDAITAIETNNLAWLADHTALPFCLMEDNSRVDIRTKEDFLIHATQIFTPAFINSLVKEKDQPVFHNWQGYAIAHGSLWADGAFGEFEITKINAPSVIKCYAIEEELRGN